MAPVDEPSAALPRRSAAWSWAMYDWANSAFATTVVAGFFPVLFKDFWSADLPATVSTFWLGLTLSLAGLAVALLAPVLGCLADQTGAHKGYLVAAAAPALTLTAGLALIPRGGWPLAAVVYGSAFVCWLISCVFYDALLVSVSTAQTVDRISGLGFSLGYLGGGLLFALDLALVLRPEWFGLLDPHLAAAARAVETQVLDAPALRELLAGVVTAPADLAAVLSDPRSPAPLLADGVRHALHAAQRQAIRWAFVSVALWWGLFTLPLVFGVRGPGRGQRPQLGRALRGGLVELRRSINEVRRRRGVGRFLVAYWLYIDGVDTVITMAVDYGKAVAVATESLLAALLLVQVVAAPFAYLFGRLGERFGAKRMILVGLGAYVFVTMLATQLSPTPWRLGSWAISGFTVLACLIGVFQGGVQALSRSYYARLVPVDKAAEFFGFYNMVGRFAAIIGPLLLGVVGRATGSPRLGLAAVTALFIGGGSLLLRAPD